MKLKVFRSNKYIYGQIVEEKTGKTKVAVSNKDLSHLSNLGDLNKTAKALEIGKLLAKKALEKGIKDVVFDRGQFKYHGRVKALAQGAREGGLKF